MSTRREYLSRKAPSKPFKTLVIKFTPEEHLAILKKSVEAGLAINDFIRSIALNGDKLKSSCPKRTIKYRSIPVKIITHT